MNTNIVDKVEFLGYKDKPQKKKVEKKVKLKRLEITQNYPGPYEFLFPYLLDQRTETAKPNLVWQADFTFLDTIVEAKPESPYYLLMIVDTFNNNIVFSKVFFFNKKRGTITSHKLLKCLKEAEVSQNIKDALILNTDRGPGFVSKEYYEYIEQHPYIKGSHSCAGNPPHNAVVERMHRTFKNQTQTHPIPKVVKRTRDLQQIIDTKLFKY